MGLTDYVQGKLLGWDDEQRSTARTTRYAIALIILFITSGLFSCSELKYSILGSKTQATITSIQSAPAINNDAVTVHYSYSDHGQTRQGVYTFNSGLEDLTAANPAGQPIEVIYIPGSPDSSKPVSARHWIYVLIFLVMSAVMGIWFTAFYLRYRKDNPGQYSRKPARRSAPPRRR